jgi:DNA-directed RNA polymerase specialized sigma24 family protein
LKTYQNTPTKHPISRRQALSHIQRKARRKKSHTRTGEEETETEDDYDDKQREEMLDEDEITAAENAFMQGREMKPDKKKHPIHRHSIC